MTPEPRLTREDLALLEALDEATPTQQQSLRRELAFDPDLAAKVRKAKATVLSLDDAFAQAPIRSVREKPPPVPDRVLARLQGMQNDLLGGLPTRLLESSRSGKVRSAAATTILRRHA
jgi:hypothetical protein